MPTSVFKDSINFTEKEDAIYFQPNLGAYLRYY